MYLAAGRKRMRIYAQHSCVREEPIDERVPDFLRTQESDQLTRTQCSARPIFCSTGPTLRTTMDRVVLNPAALSYELGVQASFDLQFIQCFSITVVLLLTYGSPSTTDLLNRNGQSITL